MDPSRSDLHAQESAFHDEWAESVSIEEIDVRRSFEGASALEGKFLVQMMGPLPGKRILDIGTGFGEAAVYFALQGADVTALDLSPKMLDLAQGLAKRYSVKVHPVVSPAETLNVPDDHFDIVYFGNVLHHIMDRERFFQQVQKTLKSGGFFYSVDPLAYNPVINVYRRLATQVRTEDERPLRLKDFRLARSYFQDVRHREFWITSLLLFLKYFFLDRIHPNQDRYWKRIFRETEASTRWLKPFFALDKFLCRVPFVRYLAWNTVMWGKKAG